MNKAWIGAVFMLVVYLILVFIAPLIRFKPWMDWWKKHQVKDYPVDCMPLKLMAYKDSSVILYDMARLFLINESQNLAESWQVDFLLGILQRWAIDVAPSGFLTPYGCCASIEPQTGNPVFDKPPNVITMSVPGVYDGPGFTGWPSVVKQNPEFKDAPVLGLWKAILYTWGCVPDFGSKTINCGGQWTTDPSNFLWNQYRIPCDSSLCESFMLETATDASGRMWFKTAMQELLGINKASGVGGWVGLVKAGGSWGGYGLDGLNAYIWSDNVLPTPTSPVEKCSGKDVASSVSQGLSMGAAFAFLGGPVATAAFSAAAGPIGILVGGALGMLTGGLLGAVETKCL